MTQQVTETHDLVDLSEVFTRIEVFAQTIAYKSAQERLRNFASACGKKHGKTYRSWRDVPYNGLKALISKMEAELNQLNEKKHGGDLRKAE
jgi:hypothetical protein